MNSKKIFLISTLLLMGCTSSTLKVDGNLNLGNIKEYDDKLAVKPLPVVEEDKAKELPKPSPQPKLGIEPTVKLQIKGKKKKKAQPGVPEESATDIVRLPEIEDKEGFLGRRPIADPFHVGEQVTLMLTYFGVSAGDATMEVRPHVQVNGRKAYHFYSTLQSSSVFSMFYKVDDWAESFVDYDEMVPFNFIMSAKETKQLREVRQFFDWKAKKVDFWEKKVTKESGVEEKKKSWDLTPYSQNIYTALQYIRVFQLRDGKTYVYPVSDDGKNWEVKATVIRREILKTDIGSFKTIVVQPQVATEGVFKPMGEVFFWYTDDDRKFPVKFESKIKIGKIVGYLKGLEKGN